MPYRLTIDLSDVYAERLQALARARNKTPEACVLDFIAACQPGGSGWVNLANDKVKKPSSLKLGAATPEPPKLPVAEPAKEQTMNGRVPDDRFLIVEGEKRALRVRGRDGKLDAPKLRQAIALLASHPDWKDHPKREALLAEAKALLASITTLPPGGL
jgi:hypothetical protein